MPFPAGLLDVEQTVRVKSRPDQQSHELSDTGVNLAHEYDLGLCLWTETRPRRIDQKITR